MIKVSQNNLGGLIVEPKYSHEGYSCAVQTMKIKMISTHSSECDGFKPYSTFSIKICYSGLKVSLIGRTEYRILM